MRSSTETSNSDKNADIQEVKQDRHVTAYPERSL
jgi:hypothetical protein